jgi:hypothetical protein
MKLALYIITKPNPQMTRAAQRLGVFGDVERAAEARRRIRVS